MKEKKAPDWIFKIIRPIVTLIIGAMFIGLVDHIRETEKNDATIMIQQLEYDEENKESKKDIAKLQEKVHDNSIVIAGLKNSQKYILQEITKIYQNFQRILGYQKTINLTKE